MRSLSARFHSVINAHGRNSNRCTCYEDEHFHVSPSKNINTDLQRLRFVLETDKSVRKAQSAIRKVQEKASDAGESNISFHDLVSELARLLARWCIGRPAQVRRWNEGTVEMRPFRASPLSTPMHADHMLSKMKDALTENEVNSNGLGFIYILRSHNPTAQAELKIGVSRFHPQHRSQELAGCLIRPEVVAHTQLLPFARRVEKLIHTELDGFRKIQWCHFCNRHHQEWFTIAIDRARRTVARWSRFILQRPYLAGRLREDITNHFEYLRSSPGFSEELDLDSYWDMAVNSIPVDETIYRRDQQVGTYLNAIWMYKNIQDWTARAPAWKHVPPLPSFDDFCDSYFCSEEANDIRKALSSLDFETLRSIYFDENNPTQIPASDALKRVLFGERAAPNSRHYDLGFPFLPDTEAKTQRLAREVIRILEHLNATTTGARSIVNPAPGTEDSPLGNATMIPVLGLLDLRYVSAPVKTYVGYDITNMGFQLVQEAYRRGEWADFPSFRRPVSLSTRIYILLGKLTAIWFGAVGLRRLIGMMSFDVSRLSSV